MELVRSSVELDAWSSSASERLAGGGEGEGLTASQVPDAMARALAKLVSALAATIGEPLCLVELEAGSNGLLGALAMELGERRGAVLRRLVAIDSRDVATHLEKGYESEIEVVPDFASAPRPGGPTVLLISGLYDRLPVHRVMMARKEHMLVLQELFVEARAGALHWVEGDPSDPAIAAYLHEHGVSLWEGQRAEVCLAAKALHARALAWLGLQGLVLVLTCGLAANRLYDPRVRREGTLVARRGHLLTADVLREPGQWCLTAHVNLDDLILAAGEGGWESASPRSAERFLELTGEGEAHPELSGSDAASVAGRWTDLAAAKRVLSPPGMGAEWKLLAQGRGRVWSAYQALATLPPRDA